MTPHEGSKIFLSCDLTGSTAFKQRRNHDPSRPWQKIFLQFYREFPQELYRQQKRLGLDGLKFRLWKPVGDELIFTCDVESEIEVYNAISVWCETMRAYKRDSLDDSPLGVKGGAFIATFPGPDSQSSIPRNPANETSDRDVVILNSEALMGTPKHRDYMYDYFGPSVDTGFRVISKCSERYMTLSVEVAYALSLLHFNKGPDAHSFDIKGLTLLDILEFKGVWGGRTYPLFALDLDAGSEITVAFRKFAPENCDPVAIHDLCQACYTSEDWPFQLYLPKSPNGHFHTPPVDPLAEYLKGAAISTEGAEELATEPVNASSVQGDAPVE